MNRIQNAVPGFKTIQKEKGARLHEKNRSHYQTV
jgi:hypothetical protein